MTRILLIHWNSAEAVEKARLGKAAGFDVDLNTVNSPEALKQLSKTAPEAIVIDLSRNPSLGREVGSSLRRRKATRHIPLVFVAGEADKVARTRALLPDAVFAEWENWQAAVEQALRNPPTQPIVRSAMDAYSGTPLPKKLGIKPGSVVSLIGEPARFREIVEMPAGAAFQGQLNGKEDLAIWFVTSQSDLRENVGRLAALVPSGGMWIAWPKKASGVQSDLSETIVRESGLGAGLVDYKIASIDKTWSGLKFAKRK